jgi:hypothetical protein
MRLAIAAPLLVLALQPHGATGGGTPPQLDVWFGPNPFHGGATIRTDFFGNVTAPAEAYPQLIGDIAFFKIFLDMLYGPPGKPGLPPGMGSSDEELKALIGVLKKGGIRTGIEVGGMRWGAGRCNASEALAYAAIEQQSVKRWLQLGGTIDSLTTDHADVWDVRGLSGPPCDPPVPMAARIDVVAQVFASWRTFLGPEASLGFIESLGFWEIAGPDGTNFTCTDPGHLDSVVGWIPKLTDVTSMLLAAAEVHNPVPSSKPLIDHYFIDFSLEGVEYDTRTYGAAAPSAGGAGPGGINFGRVLGAEAIMQKHGLKTGIFLNAFHDKALNCTDGSVPADACSASAANRTLNYTQLYLSLPAGSLRKSSHAVLEQWQPYPNVTGPEDEPYTGMWMAQSCAAAIRKAPAAAGDPRPQRQDEAKPHLGDSFGARTNRVVPQISLPQVEKMKKLPRHWQYTDYEHMAQTLDQFLFSDPRALELGLFCVGTGKSVMHNGSSWAMPSYAVSNNGLFEPK